MDPRERARELEDTIADARAELDAIYAEMVTDAGDAFLIRVADRFRDERDAARREAAELKERFSQFDIVSSTWEARFRALEARFGPLRSVVASVLNEPLSSRDRVQSQLMLAYEKVRDFDP